MTLEVDVDSEVDSGVTLEVDVDSEVDSEVTLKVDVASETGPLVFGTVTARTVVTTLSTPVSPPLGSALRKILAKVADVVIVSNGIVMLQRARMDQNSAERTQDFMILVVRFHRAREVEEYSVEKAK